MKKALGLMTGLFVFTAVNVWALSIDSITVTGATNTSGAITVSATISGAVSGMAMYEVVSTNGFNRRSFMPGYVSGTSWSDTNWTPYFTGTYVIEITAWDNAGFSGMITASTTATVSRTTSGTVNSIKYSTVPYNANGVWSNVDTTKVTLHDIGLTLDVFGVGSIGCNLQNVTNISGQVSDEQRSIIYDDTSSYKPSGTPYRFEASFHARPRGFMGMGEIKRWIWAPADTNAPDGPGILTVDITSCSAWRSSYSNALQSHVGMAPLFAPSGAGIRQNPSDMPTGMIQCTSAHYMDVGPTNTGTETEMRVGLRVNGHTGTNSYLKTFLSDTFLQQQFGLTNVYDATNILAGFVQHFDTNGVPIDSPAEVTASFNRIEGGTNIVYDYNFDGVGDSGFEAILTFEFQSSVAAMMGRGATNVVSAYSALAGDFDGDQLADPALYNTNGTWSLKLSSGGYALVPLAGLLGGSGYSAIAGDFDGDAKADPAVYQAATGTWLIKLSSSGYSVLPLANFLGGPDYVALAGDFDGDRLADPTVYQAATGTWKVKLSTAGYLEIPKPDFLGETGWAAVAADFDGDRLVDPAVYEATTESWVVLLSTSGYSVYALDPHFLGGTGYTAMGADFDGDRLADPAVAEVSTGHWQLKLSSGGYSLLDLPNFLGQ